MSIIYDIVKKPFYYLYRHGPRIGEFFGLSWGFWFNMEDSTICSELTTADTLFWTLNPNECQNIITKRFDSYFLLIIYIFLIYTIYKLLFTVLSTVWSMYINRPMIQQLTKISTELESFNTHYKDRLLLKN